MKNKFPRTALVLMFFLIPAWSFAKDGYPRNPEVDVIHYCFSIYLNDSTNRIEGTAGIEVKISGSSRMLTLDLKGQNAKGTGMKVERVVSGMNSLTFRHEQDRIEIEIPDTVKIPGSFFLSVSYAGIPADGLIVSKNKYGDRTFFGDNWPDRARHWLPCVDHPSDKATVEFIVSAPEKYKVVSNGLMVAHFPVVSANGSRTCVTHWMENVPIPTKVMVIGVADFAWETAGYSKEIPVQTWVYSRDRQPGFIDYRPAADILSFYQDLIGPYAYEKLANVQSKTMFGGMENSGCIFYYEGSVTGKNQLHSLLAHEIAHQWFGDAVTEKDWHHIWLSEGFATYLEACYADSLLNGRELDVSMAVMRKEVIRHYEETKKPVIDTTVTNFMNLLNTNSYQKGAWVLHMLRQELGDKIFWTGIRNFYGTFRDKNVMTSDFQSIMEEVSGRKLGYFFKQWLEVPGQPDLKWSWTYDKKNSQVEIDIEQTQDQYNFEFNLPIEMRGTTTVTGQAKHYRSKYSLVPIREKKSHFSFPVGFPIVEIRMDPMTQLLFQEKMVGK